MVTNLSSGFSNFRFVFPPKVQIHGSSFFPKFGSTLHLERLSCCIHPLLDQGFHHETDFTSAFFGFIAWLHASMMVFRRAIAAEKTLLAERISAFRHSPLRNSAIRLRNFSQSAVFMLYLGSVSWYCWPRCGATLVNITLWSSIVHPSKTLPDEFPSNTSGHKSYINSRGVRVQKWGVITTRSAP